jgi:hypothetical protein
VTNPRPSALSPAVLAVIAIVIVGALAVIVMFALNFGLFGPGASPTIRPGSVPPTSVLPSGVPPSQRPSSAPDATDVPPTSPGTSQPTPTPGPSLPPDQAFLFHVPDAIRATCTLEGSVGNVLQTANCTAADGSITIAYSEYDTPESLDATFTDLRTRAAQIEPDTGACEDSLTWPAEGSYSVAGEAVGRWLCLAGSAGPTIYWTDTRLNILAQAVGQATAEAGLADFWRNEAGPVP